MPCAAVRATEYDASAFWVGVLYAAVEELVKFFVYGVGNFELFVVALYCECKDLN